MQNWSLVIKCEDTKNNYCCGAVLEIDENDLILTYNESILFSIKCPCCNKINIINDRKIPIRIRKELLNIKKYELMKEVI